MAGVERFERVNRVLEVTGVARQIDLVDEAPGRW